MFILDFFVLLVLLAILILISFTWPKSKLNFVFSSKSFICRISKYTLIFPLKLQVSLDLLTHCIEISLFLGIFHHNRDTQMFRMKIDSKYCNWWFYNFHTSVLQYQTIIFDICCLKPIIFVCILKERVSLHLLILSSSIFNVLSIKAALASTDLLLNFLHQHF